MTHFVSVISLFLWGLTSILSAQNTRVPLSLKTINFCVYPIGSAQWNDLFYERQPGVFEKLRFWAFERSPTHRYTGTFPINFYHQQKNTEGILSYQIVAQAHPDDSSDKHLLFFIPTEVWNDGKRNELFEVASMKDSITLFPINTIRFLNATGSKLEGAFGKKSISLKRGISVPFSLEDLYKDEVFIGLSVQHEGELHKVLQNRWRFYPDYRELIILLPPKNAGSFRIQAYRLSQHKEEIQHQATGGTK